MHDLFWMVVVVFISKLLELYFCSQLSLCKFLSKQMIVSFYQIQSVLQAAIITLSAVGGLTLFAFQTKRDYTSMHGALVYMLFILIGIGLVRVRNDTSFFSKAVTWLQNIPAKLKKAIILAVTFV